MLGAFQKKSLEAFLDETLKKCPKKVAEKFQKEFVKQPLEKFLKAKSVLDGIFDFFLTELF